MYNYYFYCLYQCRSTFGGKSISDCRKQILLYLALGSEILSIYFKITDLKMCLIFLFNQIYPTLTITEKLFLISGFYYMPNAASDPIPNYPDTS